MHLSQGVFFIFLIHQNFTQLFIFYIFKILN